VGDYLASSAAAVEAHESVTAGGIEAAT